MITMRSLLVRPIWMTWVLLMGASVLTTWVFTVDSLDRRWALAATLMVAAWKVRLVMTDFIELRDAPLAGRLLFEGWAVLVPLTLLVLVWR